MQLKIRCTIHRSSKNIKVGTFSVIAAVAYQESHWNPDATSPTGVRGIIVLTKDTATYENQ